ncbi:MAG: error-prone DNA polymerase, partial [Planctomycetes bacterium]|nr:error-prone DNA polymerase [Planctomycetota bacterium]
MNLRDVVLADYGSTGFSLTAHPMALVRTELNRVGVRPARGLREARHGQPFRVGGLVLVRQRPSTASGIVFCTLEDETGVANLIIRPKIYERYRRVARASVALIAEGTVERQGEVVHLQTTRLIEMSGVFAELRGRSRDFH